VSTFTRLLVTGFRRLLHLDTELRPLTVLVGANGVGKSSVLEVLSLLSASAQGNLSAKIGEMGGLAALLTHDRADRLLMGTTMTVSGDAPLDYRITLAPSGLGHLIEGEFLIQQRAPVPPPFKHIESRGPDIRYYEVDKGGLVRPTWEHNPTESSLSQVPKMFREPEEFRRRLAAATFYHALEVDPRSPVRLPQPMQPADLPGRSGESLVPCLYYLRETHRDRYEAVEDALRAAFPSFERLYFPPVAAGTLAMTWKDRAFEKPLFTHQLSEGTLRFLWLATLLQSPGLPSICLIDEPEVSLHPEMLNLLANLFREASARTLVVVATHSDRLIRFLEPREVLVMDLQDDGTASAVWADSLDLDQWLAEYTLDEIWRLGRMGGRS
jgi:predicted ATPase